MKLENKSQLVNPTNKMPLQKLFALLSVWLLTLMGGQSALSQNRTSGPYILKGVILDSVAKAPVEFVTLSVLDSTRKAVAMTYTTTKGEYVLTLPQTGPYVVQASFVGYGLQTTRVVVTSTTAAIQLPPMYLASNAQVLAGVTVIGTKQLVEQKPGMLVYHAENDVTNLGGTAADVLRKAPILSVDANGNVSMRGNSNLKILINGRYSGQMARNAADALNMIPSSIIQSVEVITSPSSRYDAEGAAGVINIITKKNLNQFSGALEGSISNLERVFNPRIGWSTGKWTVNAYTHLHQYRVKTETSLTRQSTLSGTDAYQLDQQSAFNNVNPHGSGDVVVNYEADSTQLFSFAVAGWFGNWPVSSSQYYQIRQAGQQQAYRQQTQTLSAPNEGLEASLSYTKRLRKPEQSFFIIGQYSNNFRDDFTYLARQVDLENNLLYQEQNNNHQQSREWTLQTDYTHPLSKTGKHVLEMGLKTVLRAVTSDYSTLVSSAQNPENVLINPNRTNVFEYSQQVAAGYVQAKWTGNTGWFAQAGMRLEGTFLDGRFQRSLSPFTNQFINWVPSATFIKKWQDIHSLTLSYTQRISRPSIIDLNPNIDARDARSRTTGNPSLRPEALHQVELSYSLSAPSGLFFNATLFARQTNNAIEEVIQVDASGVSTATKQNLAANKQYGLNLSTSWSLLPGWSIGSNARVSYLNFRSQVLGIQREGWNAGLNINTTYKLPRQYTVQAFGNYDSWAVTLQGHQTDWFYYSLAAKKEFPKTKITVGLSTINPFAASVSRSDVVFASSSTSTMTSQYFNRAFKLTLNWKFGDSGKQRSRKGVDNSDLKSTGER